MMDENTHQELDLLASQVLTDAWGIASRPGRVDIGVNKHTWLVGEHWLSCTLAQRAEQTRRELALYAHLQERASLPGAIAVPHPLPSRAGLLVHAGGYVWWLSEHVAGRQPDPQNRLDTLAVVQGLARFHSWLQPVGPELAVSPDDSLSLFTKARALLADPQPLGFSSADLLTLHKAAELVEAALPALLLLPRQLIHGDPSHPNLRLAPGPAGSLVGALDWEACRVDFPLADLSTLGQTVVFRAGSSAPLADLTTIHAVYGLQTESRFELGDLLLFMLLGKFESIAHHGARFLRGEAQQELVLSQSAKIRVILDLLRRAKGG